MTTLTENTTFKADDVVRFKDGNGKMLLWGDHVEIAEMFVTGAMFDEDGVEQVFTSAHPYTFTFRGEDLVKVGEMYDTYYDTDSESDTFGEELYMWLPELNGREDDEMPFEGTEPEEG